MSETKAIMFLFAGGAVLSSLAGVVLAMTHANGIVYGLTVGLLAAAGGWFAGCIVVRYAKVEERRKREELFLSR
jgi:uncharacterized membrane protein